MKPVKVSREEQAILSRLTVQQLTAFVDVVEGSSFQTFVDVTNILIDIEKESFFGEKEYDERKLSLDHAFSRGGIAMLIKLLHIMAASGHEREIRQDRS